MKRRLQIGVMGSAADLSYSEENQKLAFEVGRHIAESGHVTIYGAEKDYDSLSTAASRGAKSVGGLTVGVTYGSGMNIWDDAGNTDVVIATGMGRGGGREFILINSCHAIILIAGGSGTLTEAAIAYQMNTPIVALVGSGGWADKLAGEFMDERQRLRVIPASNPADAVESAIAASET